MPLDNGLNVLTASYFLAFGCCADLHFRLTLFPFSTVYFYVTKSAIQLSCCWIPASNVYQSPHLMPHLYNHAHELLLDPWSDFSLDPPLPLILVSLRFDTAGDYGYVGSKYTSNAHVLRGNHLQAHVAVRELTTQIGIVSRTHRYAAI